MTVLALAVTGRGLVDPTEPVIRADDEGLLRGRAAFETLRVYGGRPFRLEEHLDRLTASAASIGLPGVERRRLQVLVGLVLPKAEHGDATLRLVWTAGPAGGLPSALALLGEIPEWIEPTRERGASAVSLLGLRASAPWLLPGVKSTSYAVNMAAEAEARRRGVDEALFVDADGIVLEGTVTNVWWRVRRDPLHPVPRAGHPRRRHPRDAARARAGMRVPRRGRRLPAGADARRRGGVHVVVGARGHASRRSRRHIARARACRRRPAGRASRAGG